MSYYTPGDALAARDERGIEVGRVFCGGAGCPQRNRLGTIQESSAGLVFDAPLPRGTSPLPADMWEEMVKLGRKHGQRVPIYGGVQGRSIVLLERERGEWANSPVVVCPDHGRIELDTAALVQQIRGRAGKVARIRALPDVAL